MKLFDSILRCIPKRFILVTLVICSVCIFLGVFLAMGKIWFVYPDREKYPILGIDVSHHQGVIDWWKVKQHGIGFVFLKATEWDDWVDSRFEENYAWVRNVGIPVWVYHFYSLRIPAKDQLENIIRTLSGKYLDLPIVIDLEFGGNSKFRPTVESFQNDLQILLDGIEAYQSKKPILYITYEFEKAYLQNKYSSYPLWVRDIFSYPDINPWLIWQYKNRWSIPGIEWFVDENVLSSGLDGLLLK